jgi:hypothetical protein
MRRVLSIVFSFPSIQMDILFAHFVVAGCPNYLQSSTIKTQRTDRAGRILDSLTCRPKAKEEELRLSDLPQDKSKATNRTPSDPL